MKINKYTNVFLIIIALTIGTLLLINVFFSKIKVFCIVIFLQHRVENINCIQIILHMLNTSISL